MGLQSPITQKILRSDNNAEEKQYLDLCKKIITKGNLKTDRTGTGTTQLIKISLDFCINLFYYTLQYL
jgi:hypothetical protein